MMQKVICPHCKSHRIITSKIPKDVIVVMPCPSCHEWVVLFWNRVLAVSRRILKHGTFEERKMHIASVIAQFFEQSAHAGEDDSFDGFPGMADREPGTAQSEPGLFELRNGFGFHGREDTESDHGPHTPITKDDIDRFVKIDLRRIDDPEYFKKNLG